MWCSGHLVVAAEIRSEKHSDFDKLCGIFSAGISCHFCGGVMPDTIVDNISDVTNQHFHMQHQILTTFLPRYGRLYSALYTFSDQYNSSYIFILFLVYHFIVLCLVFFLSINRFIIVSLLQLIVCLSYLLFQTILFDLLLLFLFITTDCLII